MIGSSTNGSSGGWDVWIPAKLIRSNEVGSFAFHLYLILKTYANPEGQCWPGEEALGRLLGYGERSIRDAIRTLERNGWIEIKRRKQLPNLYTLLVGSRPAAECRSRGQDRQNSVAKTGKIPSFKTGSRVPPNSYPEENSNPDELFSCPGKIPDVETGGPGILPGSPGRQPRRSRRSPLRT
jgi:biotin operon repressor